MAHWLNDFVAWAGYGESPPKFLYWAGVATIAGALRRKVWIPERGFQWTPNFYILLVGPPAGPKKTTSINFGMNFLRRISGIDFGPEDLTYPQLITHMAAAKQIYQVNNQPFEASCVTIAIDEFGTFFDPTDRKLVDNLTSLWDSKIGIVRKETKTMGYDEIVNPFLNVISGTTPDWLTSNFSSKLLGSGFASRPVFLYEEKPVKDVSYPSLEVPACSQMEAVEASLIARLLEYANYAGPFIMSPEAYKYGNEWYKQYKLEQSKRGAREAAFYERKQTHLHKLAMVISTARGDYPAITEAHLQEAHFELLKLDPDIAMIFGFVGQTKLTQGSIELVEILRKVKSIRKSDLFRRYFQRTMDINEFDTVLRGAIATGQVACRDGIFICLTGE